MKISVEKQSTRRVLELRASQAPENEPDPMIVELTGSSEEPVERYDYEQNRTYNEILSHDPADVDMSRMDGGPVLDGHRGDQIAVVEEMKIEDKRSKFRIRFSAANPRARVIYEDIKAGIRRNVSIGYEKIGVISSQKDKDGQLYVRFRWKIYELSVVTVPADPTVGVGREAQRSFELAEEPAHPVPAKKTIIC